MQNQSNSVITFDTQMKTALIGKFSCHVKSEQKWHKTRLTLRIQCQNTKRGQNGFGSKKYRVYYFLNSSAPCGARNKEVCERSTFVKFAVTVMEIFFLT